MYDREHASAAAAAAAAAAGGSRVLHQDLNVQYTVQGKADITGNDLSCGQKSGACQQCFPPAQVQVGVARSGYPTVQGPPTQWPQ
jgi:hypothetical protein